MMAVGRTPMMVECADPPAMAPVAVLLRGPCRGWLS